MDDDIDNMDFALPDIAPIQTVSTQKESNEMDAYRGMIPEHILHRLKSLSLSPESFMAHHPSCFSKDAIKTWLTIYPAYLDPSLTVAQGRRVGKHHLLPKTQPECGENQKLVLTTTVWHMAQALEQINTQASKRLEYVVEENKRYTRDYFGYGRVKVNFVKGSVVNGKTLRTKHDLLLAIADVMASLRNRYVVVPLAENASEEKEVILGADDKAQSWLVYKYALKVPRIPETHKTKVNKKKDDEKKETKEAASSSSGLQIRKRGKKGRK